MPQKNELVFIGCDCEYDHADTVVFGAPYDCTASGRPGSRYAPNLMRIESQGIESYSPYSDKDITDINVTDIGDIALSFGAPEPVLSEIERTAGRIAADGKRPLMIGGEHLVTLGAVKALVDRYPDLRIIHFDAHTDLREEYLGQSLSHATVIRRCHDLVGDGRIYQYGVRSGERQEFLWAAEHTRLNKFGFEGLENAVKELGSKPVYLTVDLDVLDPSELPGTGTPEAGGVSFKDLLRAVHAMAGLNIVGIDINELCPPADISGVSTACACKVMRDILTVLCGTPVQRI